MPQNAIKQVSLVSWHHSGNNHSLYGFGHRFTGEFTMGEILTADETADYLKVNVKTVYRLVKKGEIPGRKVGGKWRFRKDVLDEWLAVARRTFPSNVRSRRDEIS